MGQIAAMKWLSLIRADPRTEGVTEDVVSLMQSFGGAA
jgi:hypothetical protein